MVLNDFTWHVTVDSFTTGKLLVPKIFGRNLFNRHEFQQQL